MTLGELELIRIKTLKKIAKSKKSDYIAWLLIFIVCLIIGTIIFLWLFAVSKDDGNQHEFVAVLVFLFGFHYIVYLGPRSYKLQIFILLIAIFFVYKISIIFAAIYFGYLAFEMFFYSDNDKIEITNDEMSMEFRRLFKQKHILPYFEKFGYKYQMYSMIDTNHIINSKLFPRFIKHNGNDKIEGIYEGIKFEFSDIILTDREEGENIEISPDSIGIKNAKGILFYADFNKRIKSSTFILQNVKPQNMQNLKTITMDDSEFNDKFKVYSSDAQNAMYILSPALMRRILHFERRVKFPISISFVGTKIYIFIQTNKDNFEPNINKSVFKYDPAKEIKEELSHMLSIVRILKLNRKIWSV